MKMTIRQMIESEDIPDVDVYSDYSDVFTDECGRMHDAAICFVHGTKLSQKGLEKFGPILDLEVDVNGDAVVHIPEGSEEDMEKTQTLVFMFFYSITGCCPCKDYDEWFIEEDI